MSLTTKLSDKLEREIREFCKMNDLQLGEYIGTCIEKQFNLDRYGDLNKKFFPEPAKVEEKPKPREPVHIEVVKIEENPKEKIIEDKPIQKEITVEKVEEKIKPTKRTRVLQ